MNTDDLVSMLATGVTPVDLHASAKRFAAALLVGGVGAVVLVSLTFGIRPDIGQMAGVPLFWAKLAFPFFLGAGALWMTVRLARPGVAAGKTKFAVALPLLVVWGVALVAVLSASPVERLALVLGSTWRECPFNIALLSVPVFIAIMVALRGLAPTRPRAAGAAAGLLAGATATLAYSLHCPEMGVAFWAVWYVLGMSIPAIAGALAGPRILRW